MLYCLAFFLTTSGGQLRTDLLSFFLTTGGYLTAEPKWEKRDADLIVKGIIPETKEFSERSKRWLYGHGSSLDPETGKLVPKEKNKEKNEDITKELVQVIGKVRDGTLKPDRDNDELTLAHKNPEKKR